MSVLNAELRPSDHSVNLRALRRNGVVPMAIIEKGKGTLAIQASEKDIRDVLKAAHRQFQIQLTGESKPRDVMLTRIDRDALATKLVHVSVLQVAGTDVVTVDVPIVLTGTPEAVANHEGTLLAPVSSARIKAMVKDIPESIEVEVGQLELGSSIHMSELQLPPGCEIVGSTEGIVATVKHLKVEVEEAPAEEGEAVEGEEAPAEAEETAAEE